MSRIICELTQGNALCGVWRSPRLKFYFVCFTAFLGTRCDNHFVTLVVMAFNYSGRSLQTVCSPQTWRLRFYSFTKFTKFMQLLAVLCIFY